MEVVNIGTEVEVCQPLNIGFPVKGHSSVITSRGVLTCGGDNGDKRPRRLNTCIIHTKEGETRPFPSMIRSRSLFGMAVMDQSLIVVGGCCDGSDKMEKIGLNGNEWVEEDLPFSVQYHCVVSTSETMIMVIGGLDGNNVSRICFEFVIETINLKK